MLILLLSIIYFALGLLFTIYFLITGIKTLDVATKESNWAFKLIILPGTILLWPVLLLKLLNKS